MPNFVNSNSTKLQPYLGPELDLSKAPIDQVQSSVQVFINNTSPPFVIYTDMSDEAATIVMNALDNAYEEDGLLWERWGHNQWRIRTDE